MKLSELRDQYETLPHGSKRIAAIQAAIAQADAADKHRWKLYYRDELVSELVYYGDPVKALPVCAEYVELFERQPREQAKCLYLWVMSSALMCWNRLPQLTLAERDKLMAHYLKVVHRYRGSLREYHSMEFWQCLYEGKMEEAHTHQKRYMQDKPRADKDEVADSVCLACWYHNCGENYLELGDWETGMKWLQPIVDGRIRCKQEPVRTYNTLVDYALASGRRKEADHFAALLAPRVDWNKEGMPFEHSLMIRYLALTNPRQGLRRLEQVLPVLLRWWSKNIQQGFYESAWILCAALARRADWLTADMTIPLVSADAANAANAADTSGAAGTSDAAMPSGSADAAGMAGTAGTSNTAGTSDAAMPSGSAGVPEVRSVFLSLPKEFPLYRADGQYSLDALAQWFRDEVLTIAKAFDARNGYPWGQKAIDIERHAMAQMLREEWANPTPSRAAPPAETETDRRSNQRSGRPAGQPKPPLSTRNAPYSRSNQDGFNKKPQ